MESTTMTIGMTIGAELGTADVRAVTRVWSESPQPVTRRLADLVAPVQGGTLPSFGHRGVAGATQVQGDTSVLAGITAKKCTTPNYMDVPSFRTGRPPA